MIKYRYCSVYVHKRQMYIQRQLSSMGGDLMDWPPKPLDVGLTQEQLSAEIASALEDYRQISRRVLVPELQEMTKRMLEYFGEKSISAFEKHRRVISIRQDVSQGVYVLFASWEREQLCELCTLTEVAKKILECLRPATSVPGRT